MSLYRENARPPDPPPEKDTSAEWFEKLKADSDRREKFITSARVLAITTPWVLLVAFCVAVVVAQCAAADRCKAAGGVWLTNEAKCIAGREIHP